LSLELGYLLLELLGLALELRGLLLKLVRLLLWLESSLHRVLKPLLLAPLCHGLYSCSSAASSCSSLWSVVTMHIMIIEIAQCSTDRENKWGSAGAGIAAVLRELRNHAATFMPSYHHLCLCWAPGERPS
jgi:hypothetical protein